MWIPRREEDKRNWETGIDIYTLLSLCVKQRRDENLLFSTGNST